MTKTDLETLVVWLAECSHDPLKFVIEAFDWGVGELQNYDGPDEWQRDILIAVRDRIITVAEAIKIAVASGHGIGKSAFVSWIILWALSTMEDTKGVVTANTEPQLRTKTWPELAKWHRLFIGRYLFKMTATALFSADKEHEKTWRIDAVSWSEHNTEAFAGLHNQGKRLLLVFDEASAIADRVWEVAEGALTDADTEILWFAFGNPTRNTGRFRDCFGRFRHRWITRQIDSRTVKITNKEQLQRMVEDYGENSDIVKVRIRGQFPSASDRQLIPNALVDEAKTRHLRSEQYNFAPVILGVDPAWTGGDETVIYLRQGLYSKRLAAYAKNDDDIDMAGRIARFEDEYMADAVFIDMGYGTGIVSGGKMMGRHWTLVSFAGESADPGCLNKRAEIWVAMARWLADGAVIEPDQVLCDDLIGPEYHIKENGKLKMESKEDMKKRGLPSPNRADALALTFAFPVVKREFLQARADANGQFFCNNSKKYNPIRRRLT